MELRLQVPGDHIHEEAVDITPVYISYECNYDDCSYTPSMMESIDDK